MSSLFRWRSRAPRIEWCHGDSCGSVNVVSSSEGAVVTVKCNQCAADQWTVKHTECPACGYGRFGTSCVRNGEDGYKVTFTCTKCGYGDVHLQREPL